MGLQSYRGGSEKWGHLSESAQWVQALLVPAPVASAAFHSWPRWAETAHLGLICKVQQLPTRLFSPLGNSQGGELSPGGEGVETWVLSATCYHFAVWSWTSALPTLGLNFPT